MSQERPYREFKFVDNATRKRRRRAVRQPVVEPKPRRDAKVAQVVSSNSLQGPAPSSTTHERSHGELADLPLSVELSEPDEISVSRILSPTDDGVLSGIYDAADYAFGDNSINPFFDPGASAATSADQLGNISFYFGSDSTTLQVDKPSSMPNAAKDTQGRASADSEASPDEAEVTEFNVNSCHQTRISDLPWLNFNIGSSNLGNSTTSQLLSRYNQEFCVMPLTHDFKANPFRFIAEPGQGSHILWHSILALSYRHLNHETGVYSKEAKSHKDAALQMLRDLDSATEDASLEPTVLDAVLILMTLDCATSAHGPWVWYLKRAHRMIRATEAIHDRMTARMQAGIEMLVWWDVTLALTTRQGCVLTESTVANLFKPARNAEPTFYSVSGCPEELFKQMIRLGSYAREFELAATMVCVEFNMEPVREVERAIREWQDQEYGDIYGLFSLEKLPEGYNLANMMHREDLHHCAEAWRYALLLYIARVFRWQRGVPPSPSLSFLARRTLNHVISCRRDSMVQKQLLLPVFLAGCEITDEHLRQEARQYCVWWSNRTRYDMFSTTRELLEEVWLNPSPTSWWGSLIDEKGRSSKSPCLSKGRQYLFG